MRLRDWLNSEIVPQHSPLADLYPGKVWHYLLTIAIGLACVVGGIVAAVIYAG